MNKYCLLALVLLTAIGARSSAQTSGDDNSPEPKPPFVADLPSDASWTITFSPKLKAGSAPPAKMALVNQVTLDDGMARSEVTKKGRLKKIQMVWLDGRQSQDWVAEGIYFHQDPDSKAYAVTSPTDSPYGPTAAQRDFPDLNWIDSSHFSNVEKKGIETCFVYKWTKTRPRFDALGNRADLGAPYEPTVVWISTKTGLPIARESADLSVTYQYLSPTENTLSLPPECQKLLDIILNYQKKLQSERPANPL